MRVVVRRHGARLQLLLLSLVVVATAAWSEEPPADEIRLPAATGPHSVGTAVWHWQDRQGDALLEVMAQLWYPSRDTGGATTRYRPLGGQAFDRVRQHSIGNAAFASLDSAAPVILICPGRGTNRYYYTSLAEDLASRGFAVFAVDIPLTGYVEFPDGRIIEPSPAFRPSFELITGPYDKVDEFFEPAVETGLRHLRLALDKLAAINMNDPAGILAGRLNLRSLGAFGHSLGGRICGALAGTDERVVAYATMEGVPPREIRRNGMRAASLQLYSSELPEEMALPNIRELYDSRIAESTILRVEGLGHNSVTDRPLVFPDGYELAVSAERGLEVFRHILGAFFQAHLGIGEFSPAGLAAAPEVTVIESSIGNSPPG